MEHNTPPFHSLFPLVYNEWKNERKRETSGKKEMNGLFLFCGVLCWKWRERGKETHAPLFTPHITAQHKEQGMVVCSVRKKESVLPLPFFLYHNTTPLIVVLYSSSLCSLFKSRATFLSACIWTKHKEEEEEGSEKWSELEQRTSGMRAFVRFTALHSFHSCYNRKSQNKKGKHALHFVPFVFPLFNLGLFLPFPFQLSTNERREVRGLI